MRNNTIETQAQQFISALRADYPDSPIHFRLLRPKNAPENDPRWKPANRVYPVADFSERLRSEAEDRGVYFVVNVGGGDDTSITNYSAAFCESDTVSIEEQHRRLDASPLPTSARIETAKSVHAYWFLTPGTSEAQWREIQARLIAFFDGDRTIKNPSRVMRLPGFNHTRLSGDQIIRKPVTCLQLNPERRYTAIEMLEAFPAISSKDAGAPSLSGKHPLMPQPLVDGQGRNEALFLFVVTLWKQGFMTVEEIRAAAWARNMAFAEPLDESEFDSVVVSACRYEQEQKEAQQAAMSEEVERNNRAAEAEIKIGKKGEEMLRTTINLPDFLIWGTARGQVSAFVSDNGVGKTTVLRNMALSLCVGKQYLDLVKVGKAYKVAYFDFEDDEALSQLDIQTMGAEFDEYEQELLSKNLFYSADIWINDEGLKLSNPAHWNFVLAALDEFKPDLIIVDTMAEAFEYADENSNAEMSRAVVKPLKKLANRYSAAVIVAHHTNKTENGTALSNRMRGASSLGGAMRSQYYLSLVGEGAQKQVRLQHSKAKGKKMRDFYLPHDMSGEIRWLHPLENIPNPQIEIPPDQRTFNSLYNAVKAAPQNRISKAQAIEAAKVDPKTFEKHIKRILDRGTLIKESEGKGKPVYFRLPDNLVEASESSSVTSIEEYKAKAA